MDLIEHRDAVCRTLRRNAHQVTNMEDYVAIDERPLTVCLGDVAKCDVYVGIFAWRYGYIPPKDNPHRRSITELEFRHAVDNGKGCLIFLLDPNAEWKFTNVEQGPGMARLKTLRDELARDYTPKLFKEIDELATEVLTAINSWEMQHRQRANEHDARTVGQGLNALGELMWTPSVQAAVARFRTEFSAACEQIDVLGNDKDLHDELHDLQHLCYNPIAETIRLPGHEASWSQIERYKLHLQPIIDRLQLIADRPSVMPIDVSWMCDLVESQESLDRAIENTDFSLLQEAIWLMRPVVTVHPSRINTRLKTTTSRLVPHLANLVDAMAQVSEGLDQTDARHPDLDPENVRQFQAGVDSLVRLNDSLDAQVKEHDSWQVVDDTLRMIENDLEQGMDQLIWSLRRSLRATELLYRDSTEKWARSLKIQADKLADAITVRNHARIKDIFLMYRSEAGYRFYVVDQKLKDLCDQLRNIDKPLAGVLKEINA
jgi:hypothetical protein